MKAAVPIMSPDIAFIVTKPLQLMFAVAIIRQLGAANRSCIIITDSFNGAELVAERLRLVDWDLSAMGVLFCRDRSKAEQVAADMGAKKIFVDGDVGFRRYLILMKTQLRHSKPEIWVYEEGLGTYRTDLYRNLKRVMFRLLGVGTHFGGSSIAAGIYVLAPDEYRNAFPSCDKAIHRIASAPCDTINRDFAIWCEIFAYVPLTHARQETCTLYLSSWQIDPKVVEKLKASPGDLYFKPHPHLKSAHSINDVRLIAGTSPAEILLIDLSKCYRQVCVVHHGSSTAHYFSHRNVVFIHV